MPTPEEDTELKLHLEAIKAEREKEELLLKQQQIKNQLQERKIIYGADGKEQINNSLNESIEQSTKLDMETYIEWSTIMMRIFSGWAKLAEEFKADGLSWYAVYQTVAPKAKELASTGKEWVNYKLGREKSPSHYNFSYTVNINSENKVETKGLTYNKTMPDDLKKATDTLFFRWVEEQGYTYEPTEKVFKHKITGNKMDNETLERLNVGKNSFVNHLKNVDKIIMESVSLGGKNEPAATAAPSPLSTVPRVS